MRNKFFFGVVVGFFVAFVAFVVFLFFSGSVKARSSVLTNPQVAVVHQVGVVDVDYQVNEGLVAVKDVPLDMVGVKRGTHDVVMQDAVAVRQDVPTVVHEDVDDVIV